MLLNGNWPGFRRPVVATHGSSGAVADKAYGESWLLRTGLTITVWTLAGIATVLAASGQVEFARWAGINDIRAYGVPAVLELVAVAFLLIGYRRARRGDSAMGMWLLATVIGAFAVYTNVVHTGGRSGLIFGAASAITLVLWFVKLRDDYRHFQRHTGQATKPRPKFGTLWLVAPRLSVRAWVIATRRRISTVDDAVGYAEVWRAVYEDTRKARVSRRLARRTAWRSVAEVAGGSWTELPRVAEIAAVQVRQRSGDTDELDGQRDRGLASRPAQQPQVAAAPAPARVGAPDQRPVTDPVPQLGPAPRSPAAVAVPPLRDRVFAFLDEHAGSEYTIDESDEPYLAWSVAGALEASPDAVAEHVRAWRLALPGAHPRSTAPVPVSPAPPVRQANAYQVR